jgi:adenylate kinase family enzyme
VAQSKAGRFPIKEVIHLSASENAVKTRRRARGGADDQEDVIEERFREYAQLTRPLLDWYRQHGIKVVDIDAERSPDQVHADLIKLLESN